MVYALALNGCHQAASAHAETEPEVQFYLLFQKALCLFTTDAYIQCTEYRHSTLAYSKAGEPFCTIYSLETHRLTETEPFFFERSGYTETQPYTTLMADGWFSQRMILHPVLS